jgi:amino acid transporter
MTKKISLFSLVLLVIAAIDSIRNLPASALFGPALIFFFIFSAIVFLFPTSLVAAELSATFPEKGGVYHWVLKAFGQKTAMFAIWLQWINTMVWYPTILSFVAGTAAYLINPALAQNEIYLVTVILSVFWILTVINLFGLNTSARFNSFCVTIGTILPLIFLVLLGVIWVFAGKPLQIQVTASNVFPSLTNSTSWISLIAIMAGFLGMELSGVHVNDIRNPQKNFPRAILYSCLFILLSMMFGSLAIAYVLPADQINLVAGVMQVFTNFFTSFNMQWCIPILTLCIVIGSIGGMTNWLISPAKGLLHAAEFGFMPRFFTKLNRHGVASRILLAQAILVSLFCTAFLLVPSINAFYWFLTALSTELYMIMYVLMFLAAVRLHHKYIDRPKVFKIPYGNGGMWITCLLGLFGCFVTLIVGFFPPDNIQISSTARYAVMIGLGNLLMISPVFLFYWYKERKAETR